MKHSFFSTTHKGCPKCGEIKLHNEFAIDKRPRNKRGLHSICKQCVAIYKNQWYQKQPTNTLKTLQQHLKYKFQLSLEEYYARLQAQQYLCEICGIDLRTKLRNPSVDHCHKTGKIRGLLCSNCNVGLGSFKDNPQILQNAIKYLDWHKET